MKIVCNKKVYDTDYGYYELVTELPSEWTKNAIGNMVKTTKELRKDKMNGEFYILSFVYGYSREDYRVIPVSKEEAATLSEQLLDYQSYVKFFGDPEGYDQGLKRERDQALQELKSTEESKDYWYKEYENAQKRIRELESNNISKKEDEQ